MLYQHQFTKMFRFDISIPLSNTYCHVVLMMENRNNFRVHHHVWTRRRDEISYVNKFCINKQYSLSSLEVSIFSEFFEIFFQPKLLYKNLSIIWTSWFRLVSFFLIKQNGDAYGKMAVSKYHAYVYHKMCTDNITKNSPGKLIIHVQ